MSADPRPVVTLLSLGGTISMTSDGGGAVLPRLDADALVASIGPVAERVEVRARAIRRVSGPSLRLDDIYELADVIESCLDGGSDGVVVSQGTDTIEETAFLLDLLLERREPIVITGAMRAPSAPGADGAANLAAAVVTAASRLDLHGVVVVVNDEIHAAARVQKRHSFRTSAFASDGGELGFVSENKVRLRSRPVNRAQAVPRGSATASVPIVTIVLGDDGRGLQVAEGADGVVIAALGAGHVPEWLVGSIASIARRIPVVMVSRTRGGPVLTATYGFPGSELDLRSRGIVTVGSLDAVKARILLVALLRAGLDRAEIEAGLLLADATL